MKRLIAKEIHRVVNREARKYRWVCLGPIKNGRHKGTCCQEYDHNPGECIDCGCRHFRRTIVESHMTKEELDKASEGVWE